jgi:hypothetical protein
MARLSNMKPNFRTLALVAVASGMLASAYLIGPAPAATTANTGTPAVARPAPVQTLLASAPARPESKFKVLGAPVPLAVNKHDQYFDTKSVPDTATPPQGPTIASLTSDQPAGASGNDGVAKSAIEQDGYRNVRGLVQTPDGTWHGRAMRGRTEIAVSVYPNGNVAQD